MTTSDLLRADLLRAFSTAVVRASPAPAIRRLCRRNGAILEIGDDVVDLDGVGRILLVGAGKAVVPLAAALLELLPVEVTELSLTTRHGHVGEQEFEAWEAGHPIPDVGSLAGAADALRICRSAEAGDLVLCLLTGGASALWAAPSAGIPLDDLRVLTEQLLRSGAPIEEMNCVRKHLSILSGGRLATATAPARIITIAISDVVGNRLDAIGSGPTVGDSTTYEEALGILTRRGVTAPSTVTSHLQKGAAGEIPETPKPGELEPGSFYILCDLSDALAGAAADLQRAGYQTLFLPLDPTGDAATTGRSIVREAVRMHADGARRIALLWGGESTVHVTGDGVGGRNLEMAVAAAGELEGTGIVFASFATDGSDGPTPAAGGFVDGSSVARANDLGMDWGEMARRNDSYTLLSALGDLIVTGPTGTNVNDLAIALIG